MQRSCPLPCVVSLRLDPVPGSLADEAGSAAACVAQPASSVVPSPSRDEGGPPEGNLPPSELASRWLLCVDTYRRRGYTQRGSSKGQKQ